MTPAPKSIARDAAKPKGLSFEKTERPRDQPAHDHPAGATRSDRFGRIARRRGDLSQSCHRRHRKRRARGMGADGHRADQRRRRRHRHATAASARRSAARRLPARTGGPRQSWKNTITATRRKTTASKNGAPNTIMSLDKYEKELERWEKLAARNSAAKARDIRVVIHSLIALSHATEKDCLAPASEMTARISILSSRTK